QRRIDFTSVPEDLVGGVARFGGADGLFEEQADFIACSMTQPVVNAADDDLRIRRNGRIVFPEKLCNDRCGPLAKLFVLFVTLPPRPFSRDLLFRSRLELRAFSLKEESVCRQGSEYGRCRLGAAFGEKQ